MVAFGLRSGVLIRRVFLPLFLVALMTLQVEVIYRHVILSPQSSSIEPRDAVSQSSSSVTHLQKEKPTCFRAPVSRPTKLFINTTVPTPDELGRLFPHIQAGGHWQPDHCQQRQKLGIFIPLRNRWSHAAVLLRHLHQLLVRQWRHYTIFVIEQADDAPFNRGKLLNVGVVEALKLEPDLDCFILHDVDTLPETVFTIYKCHEDPRFVIQMATYQMKRNYKTAYKGYTGGVLAIRRSQFENINGFSNEFWGWGGEDDDLGNRLDYKGYQVARELSRGGYFSSLDHPQETPNPNRYDIVQSHVKNRHSEGMNSIDYTVLKMKRHRLFTLFSVIF